MGTAWIHHVSLADLKSSFRVYFRTWCCVQGTCFKCILIEIPLVANATWEQHEDIKCNTCLMTRIGCRIWIYQAPLLCTNHYFSFAQTDLQTWFTGTEAADMKSKDDSGPQITAWPPCLCHRTLNPKLQIRALADGTRYLGWSQKKLGQCVKRENPPPAAKTNMRDGEQWS